MKTLTEFSGVVLRTAHKAREQHSAPGLEPNQLSELVGEMVGIAGDRLARLFEALDVVGDRLDRTRLVRVYQGETGPERAKSIGEYHYLVDLIVQATKAKGRAKPGGGKRRDDSGRRDGRPRSSSGPGQSGGPQREREPARRDVPSAGAGWTLERAPGDRDSRGRKGKRPDERRGRGPKRPPRKPPRPPSQREGESRATEAGAAAPRNTTSPPIKRPGKARPSAPRPGIRRATPTNEPVVEHRKSGAAAQTQERKRKRRPSAGQTQAGANPQLTEAAKIHVERDANDPEHTANRRLVTLAPATDSNGHADSAQVAATLPSAPSRPPESPGEGNAGPTPE